MSRKEKPLRRQVFVLTQEEKRIVCFVIVAFLLGLATKHYRDAHPRPVPPASAQEQKAAKGAALN